MKRNTIECKRLKNIALLFRENEKIVSMEEQQNELYSIRPCTYFFKRQLCGYGFRMSIRNRFSKSLAKRPAGAA